jgi:hypothetical protein
MSFLNLIFRCVLPLRQSQYTMGGLNALDLGSHTFQLAYHYM